MKIWPDWTLEESLMNNKKIELQPKDAKLFGSLVKTEEEIKAINDAAENEWKNRAIKTEMALKKAKVEEHFSSPIDDEKWEAGASYNSLLKKKLSKEEIEKRNMDVTER